MKLFAKNKRFEKFVTDLIIFWFIFDNPQSIKFFLVLYFYQSLKSRLRIVDLLDLLQ